ncbi:prephenate dehydratase [Vagococcus vulneris]|uniref:Prephenate dehydratase n=1 Tax=Vagococcus vulneris TaxID=1977869 RepID=A0A430A2Q2_9ENTE|nr:prephenate dehydratase [Vagococcus vulneris]RSU00705.1 hypothetical protein CBF37_01465 [Vagococcus vulneris]
MKVGYLGPYGSFTSIVANYFEKADIKLKDYTSIAKCLKAVESGEVHAAVVPIENSIEGTVNTTLDYMYHYLNQSVVCEIVLPINQQLMVHPNFKNNWQLCNKIYSHPQALAQTQLFLEEHLNHAVQIMTESTTEAAEIIANHSDIPIAAIASVEAAETFGLSIVSRDIQDFQENQTRFWVIGTELVKPSMLQKHVSKQSFGIQMTDNRPGNLHRILSVFSWREIDLSKIESRPLRTKLGDYYFLIDVIHDNNQLMQNALEELTILGAQIRDFGKYPVYIAPIV